MAKQTKALAPYLTSNDDVDLSAIDAYLADNRPPPEPPKKRSILTRMAGDAGLSLLKGAIAVPETAVGLADIATGGRVGKFLENEGGAIGFRPQQARQFLDEQYSPEQQEAFRRVQQADGLVDTAVEAVRNPSVIAHSVIESVPSILAGGAIGRGAAAVLPRMSGELAGAIGEGTVSAGQTAEQVRQDSADGRLTPQQAAIAGVSGGLNVGLGLLGGKLAHRLGAADVDTMVAGAAKNPQVAEGVLRRVLKGATTEGLLEELPQSVQEQVAQNLAKGKPIEEGVSQAAVLGTLSGAAMGAGVNMLPQRSARMGDAPPPPPPPPSGPMGRAVQSGIDWENVNLPQNQTPADLTLAAAQGADEGIPFEADPQFERAPIYPNGAAPVGRQFGTRKAANIALGEQGLMGSHDVQETAPGVFEIRPSAAPGMRMVQPGIYEATSQPPQAAPRTPLAMPSPELMREGVDHETGELPPPPPPPAAPAAPGERPTTRGPDNTQRAVFDSEQEAADYISQARRRPRNAAIREVPVRMPDGKWTLAKPGEDGYSGARIAPEDAPDFGANEPDGDVLNSQGKPFTTKRGARMAAKAKGDGWEPVKVDGGFVVRKRAATPAAQAPGIEQPEPSDITSRADPRHVADEADRGRQAMPNADALRVATIKTPSGGEHSGLKPVAGTNAGAPDGNAEGMSGSRGAAAPVASAPTVEERGQAAPAAQASGAAATGDGHEVNVNGAAQTGELGVLAPPADTVDAAAHEAATSPSNDRSEPTEAQKKAGNYKMGHDTIGGLNISFENPAGSVRRGVDRDGKPWESQLHHHYGYIKGTVGADKDHVDVFVAPHTPRNFAGTVFVVDQVHPDSGKFDEHKALIGFDSIEQAIKAYRSNYHAGWNGMHAISAMPMNEFKAWVTDPMNTKKPLVPIRPKRFQTAKDVSDAVIVDNAPATIALPAPEKARPEAPAAARGEAEQPASSARPADAGLPADAQAGGVADGAWWDAADKATRLDALKAAGWGFGKAGPSINASQMATKKWADMTDSQRTRLSATRTAAAPESTAATADEASQAEQTRQRRADVLAYLGDGWRAKSGNDGRQDQYIKVENGVRVLLRIDSAADGEYYVSASYTDPKRGHIDFTNRSTTLEEAKAAADAFLARWAGPPARQGKPIDLGEVKAREPAPPSDATNAPDEAPAAEPPKAQPPAPEPPKAQPPAPEPPAVKPPPPPAPRPQPSSNTLVTDEAAERARAVLRDKLKLKGGPGRTQRGSAPMLDPDVLQAGITLAVYHIERGARKFAAYVQAMVDDLGDEVRPYLKSWYMATKYDPRYDALEGLDTADTVEASSVDATAEPAQTAAVTEEKPDDSPAPISAPSLDQAMAEGLAASTEPIRGAGSPRTRNRRADDRGLRGQRGLFDGVDDGQGDVGDLGGNADVSSGPDDSVAGDGGNVSATDFRAFRYPGVLTREGSWYDTAARNVDLIELALKIEQEGRPATPDEQAQLAKYVGFGASEIRNALFPVPSSYAKQQDPNRLIWPNLTRDARWRALAERLEALPTEWQRSVLQSTQYAHYTSEGIIRSVWSAMQRMGFTGGKILEPGMGIGSFAMLMPDTVHRTSKYTGVEFDGPTALIARLLSPQQNMLHDDFIKRRLPKDFFDVAIGNPPFSQTRVLGDPEYEKHGFMLHDFFFAKSIDRVRPGGLLVFVTSKGTMDKKSDKARKYLSDRADLLGAIRLPQTAFEENAGTKVVTDVIFLRKRLPGEAPAGHAWAEVKSIDTKDGPVFVNEYFAANPHMVLGQQRISGNRDDEGRYIAGLRSSGEYTVVSYDKTPAELDAKFAAAVENLPRNAYSPMTGSAKTLREETAKVDFDPNVKREGVVYVADDGTIMRVDGGVGRPLEEKVKLSEKDKAWFKGYVHLRDLVQAARAAQINDGDWEGALKALNTAYDAFRQEHGPIRDFRVQVRKSTDEEGNIVETPIRIFKNRRLFREDYDSAIVTQLEAINEAGEIRKAAFMLGRTIGKPVVRQIKTVGDALAVSLDEIGRLDLDDIARRIKLTREEVIDALGNQVYRTPQGEWQLADEYLSGDVVAKLEEAMDAARVDKSLERNVEALKAVQPEKLGPSQIAVKLGADWVPVAYINEFAEEIGAGHVTFDAKTESWEVEGGNLRSERMAGAEYGTADRSPSELLEAALNSRPVTIKRRTEDKKEVTDTAATTAANEVIRKIRDKFKSWVWTDAERATDLVEIYNRRFNNIAPRRFDGSHLTLPGVSLRFKLHPHQLRAIWRQIQTGDTYLAHAVGSGKTIEMIAGGMEQKRLGLIKKPMYVVPNHMLEQFANEFMELYPLANIMVADDENFSAERRKAFVAAATLNAPDAIIITHSAFERIGLKEESVAPIRDAILSDLEIELAEAGKRDRVRRSQLQQQIEAVTQRFDSIIGASKKDSTVTFEDIGADMLFVDEAHAYRKLDFTTNQKIKGIDPNGSRRALDMYVKTRYLQRKRPGRAMVFASGTPVTNTMGELYTVMRFFAPDELERDGIATFDGWSRQFGEVVPALEANAAGRYEVVERFAKFDNVPELMSRVRQFMDVLTSEQLGALVKRPEIEGGKPNLVTVEATPALKEYMKTRLLPRLEASRNWKPSKDEPFNPDPVISITTDGRFAALDPRFFGATVDDNTPTKLHAMADAIVAEYKATANNVYTDTETGTDDPLKGGTQIVFYNLGFGEQSQKNRGFNARAALTKRLVDGGVQRDHILWFDDADTDAKKEAMFKAMRSGQARILIGSAKKMGTGVNVQKRLTMLHYFDPPWYPSDVEQPLGRIIRQGNQNERVRINWYATKDTYDATMWQMVARKQRFIDQAFTGDKSLRSMDDMSEASMFEQAAAVASGDPRALQLAGLRQDVERLERLQAAHHNEQVNVRHALRNAEWDVNLDHDRIRIYGAAFKALGERYVSFATGKVGRAVFDKMSEFGQALKDAFNQKAADHAMDPKPDPIDLGEVNGIALKMHPDFEREGKPTGNFELVAHIGPYQADVVTAATMGADVDAVGLARRIVNTLNGVETKLNQAKRDLASHETDVTRLRKKLGAPFEYTQELAEKYGELKRLEEELKAEGEAEAAAAAAPASPVIREDGSAEGEPPADPAVFSRAGTVGHGVPMRDARAVIATIRKALPKAPPIHLHEKVSQAPRALVAQIRAIGAERTVHAAFHEGEIHVFPGNIGSIEDMQFIVGHHEIRHYGMRAMLGPRLGPVMLDIYNSNAQVRAAADAKIAAGLAGSRVEAVEEALADMPVDKVAGVRGFGRLAAMLRSWLRTIAGKFRALGLTRLADSIEPEKWSDSDVARFILKAEDISRTGGEQFRTGGTVFDRAPAADATGSDEAKRDPFNVKGATGNTLAHYRGMAMQALGRRQIVDLWAKDLPQLAVYNDLVQRMDADKNDAGAEADSIATAWGKLKDERALAELMHDATLAQIDPAKDYSIGDSRPEYDALRSRYNALSDEAKAIYKQARDSYAAHYAAVKDAIRARLERSMISSDRRRALLEKMEEDFFKAKKGVYFPLARFGKYVVLVRDADGKVVSVSRAETINEADTVRTRLLADYPAAKGFKVGKVLKDKEFNARLYGPGKGFMDELFEVLEAGNASADLQDAVSQLYLASLPDLSWAKHGIHRKGTPGFSQDARRAFAQNMFHGARYLAKLRYADRLQDQLMQMQEHVNERAEDEDFDSVKAQQVVDEMVKRHETLMNPQTNPISTALTSVGFVFHLGLSPASALVNLLQTPMVAYPIMGAKWGYDKAASALMKASREAAANKNDISRALNGDERAAYDEAVRAGVIDVTMAHDLAGIASGEDSKVTWKLRPVMKWASFLFHHAEKFNRQVTFMAAYRLAREAGATHAEAYEQAADATYKGHFDYSASNRPRLMAGNWAKVLLLFKQFGQNMVYTLSRQAYLATKGATQAERKEARKALGGLLVTHAMGAGALGMPMVGTLLAAASWLGGSDDEPWDAEAALQNMLADALGTKAAEVLAHGLSRLTPWDISGRVGLNQMILPDIREGLEGRDLWEEIAVSALGPVAAIAGGALDGMQQISRGRVATGLEAMLPAVLRAPVRAYRYGTEGAVDRTGITIVDEVSAAGVAGQVLGLSPSEVRHATEGRSAIYRADKALVDRRSTLMAMYAKAQMANDADGLADVREQIASFNEKHPGRRITPQNLRASIAARRRRIAQAEQGIYLPFNRRDAMEAGRFAATIE